MRQLNFLMKNKKLMGHNLANTIRHFDRFSVKMYIKFLIASKNRKKQPQKPVNVITIYPTL